MNPALELFLLFASLALGIAAVGAYLSRDLIKRTCKIIIDKDREEQRQLDERKQEGVNRLQAEKEIDEALSVYEEPKDEPKKDEPKNENRPKLRIVEGKDRTKEEQ